MNNKAFFTFLMLAFSFFLHAQEFSAPDYDLIKKNIENKKSEYYYPSLLKKLKENDTVFTVEQYRHLYYGYTFQKKYNPYYRSKNEDLIRDYYKKEKSDTKEYPKIIKAFREVLAEDPLNIRAMNFLAYIYNLNGEESMAAKVSANFQGIFGAIMSSGDGLKCETGFHVIAISDEYVILNIFEMQASSQSFNNNCDYIKFEADKYKVPGMYFDVSVMQEKK